METFSTLMNLACGGALLAHDDGRPRRVQLMFAALLLSLLFAALWGAAAGVGTSTTMVLQNLYKVPMVVLLSALCALPAGMLSWKLSGSALRASDMLLAFATAVLAGTLVLAVMAPLVAIYYRTSAWAGPAIALVSTFLALAVATVIFIRGVAIRAPSTANRVAVQFPAFVVLLFLVATMVQFISIASPILPEITVFDGGIDRMVQQP
jgi:hypothetical protein